MIAAIVVAAKSQSAVGVEITFESPVFITQYQYPKYLYDSNDTVGFFRSGTTTVGSHNYGDHTEQRISIDVPSVRDVFQERGRWSENCNGFGAEGAALGETTSFSGVGALSQPKARFSFSTGQSSGPVPCYTALIAADANFSTSVSKWLQNSVQVTGQSAVGAWSYGGSEYDDTTYGGCACLGWTAGTVAVDGVRQVSAPESYFDALAATFGVSNSSSSPARRGRRDISGVSVHYQGENSAFARTVPFEGTGADAVPSLFDNMEDLDPWSGTNAFSRERLGARGPVALSDARIPAIELVLYPCRYEGYTWEVDSMVKEIGTGDGLVSPIATPRSSGAEIIGLSALNAGGTQDVLTTDASKEAFKNAVPSELGLRFTMAADVRTPEQRMDADPMAMAPPVLEASSDVSTSEIVALSLAGTAILIAVVVAAVMFSNSNIRCGDKLAW
jgi:hypothetical protein